MIRQLFIGGMFFLTTVSFAQGLILEKINPNSILYQQGVREGDAILAINGEKIDNASEARKIFASLKSSQKVQLLLKPASSPNKKQTLTIQLPATQPNLY